MGVAKRLSLSKVNFLGSPWRNLIAVSALRKTSKLMARFSRHLDLQHLRALSFSVVLLAAPTDAVSRDFLIQGADLDCIIDNAEAYLGQTLQFYLIPVASCPEPLPPGGYKLSDLAESAAPDLPPANERLSRFLSLTPRDLECLQELVVFNPSAIYRFSTETCTAELVRE